MARLPRITAASGPGVIDALSLLSEVASELVVKSARDTHFALADRVGASTVPGLMHHGVAGARYGGARGGVPRRDRTGTTYGEAVAARGWTPVFLRGNTGLSLRENGVALSALMQRVVDAWPVPIAWGIGHGARGLSRLPETAAFGRFLDWRSVGVHDLVTGLAEDVPPLPHASYRLVMATLTESYRHPVGHFVGDWLVRPHSAQGHDRRGGRLFPGAETLHGGRTDHFGLLNHPKVHSAMERWLA